MRVWSVWKPRGLMVLGQAVPTNSNQPPYVLLQAEAPGGAGVTVPASNATNFNQLSLCFPLSRLKHLVVQELQPQQQQQQAAHQLKLQQAALLTATAAAASAATPGGTAAVPLPAVVPPPPSGVVVVAPAPPANPKWVDRPRTSLHARAYLRLGMWQWSMNEVRGRGALLRLRVWATHLSLNAHTYQWLGMSCKPCSP